MKCYYVVLAIIILSIFLTISPGVMSRYKPRWDRDFGFSPYDSIKSGILWQNFLPPVGGLPSKWLETDQNNQQTESGTGTVACLMSIRSDFLLYSFPVFMYNAYNILIKNIIKQKWLASTQTLLRQGSASNLRLLLLSCSTSFSNFCRSFVDNELNDRSCRQKISYRRPVFSRAYVLRHMDRVINHPIYQ